MGTRSLTYFFADDKPFCAFYRQMDGYPEGHGVELGEILAPVTLVNGYQMNMTAGEFANGPGCLAAQVIQRLKEEHGIGGIYMITPNPEDHKEGWQEYEYHVHINTVGEGFTAKYVGSIEVVSVGSDENTTIFSGGWADFLKWAKKPKRVKDGDYVPVIKPLPVAIDKPELRTALKDGVVTVTFTKASGERRVMKCTQNFELIPEDKHPGSNGRIRHTDKNLVNVFDLEKNDWRSFREESVIKYEVA